MVKIAYQVNEINELNKKAAEVDIPGSDEKAEVPDDKAEMFKDKTKKDEKSDDKKSEEKKKKVDKPYQDDIICEVCGYEGQPTYDGRCPVCYAIGGHKPVELPPAKLPGDDATTPAEYNMYSAELQQAYADRMWENI
jgi:hypothetical protein